MARYFVCLLIGAVLSACTPDPRQAVPVNDGPQTQVVFGFAPGRMTGSCRLGIGPAGGQTIDT